MFTKATAKHYDISKSGSHGSVMSFNHDAYMNIKFSDYKTHDTFSDAVDKITYLGGRTNIHLVLRKALDEMFQSKNGMRSDSNKILILITDGHSDDSQYTNLNTEFQKNNIALVVVGVGNINEISLRKLVVDEKN